MEIRILSAEDVRTALPMPKAIEAMKLAFGEYSSGKATVPLRSSIATAGGVTLLMPAYLAASQTLAVKLLSLYDGNPSRGLPRITAVVLVFDPQSGIPLAIMDGQSLTALRTGAAGGLAADLLSRQDAKAVTLFGAGVQARTQLQAVMAVRAIERLLILDPVRDAAERLAAEVAAWPSPPRSIDLPASADAAVSEADIVIAATTSSRPLFDGKRLRPGCHVTAVGAFTPDAREVDDATVGRARVVVDSREACLEESGDIIQSQAHIDAELGEIVNGARPARVTEGEITFFKSVGLAVQDAAAAFMVLKEADRLGIGSRAGL
jgi:ornithine cyclodeaminase